MTRRIAFLRGINVGGHRVKMDRLRGLFEELGLRDVSTFIASGNVIFSDDGEDCDALRARIERHLADNLGYAVPTFLRPPARIEEILEEADPADGDSEATGHSVFVIFMRAPADDSLRTALGALSSEIDEFRCSGSEVYWRVQGKLTDSPLFGKGLDEALRGVPNSMRNLNTLRRLSSKIEKEAS